MTKAAIIQTNGGSREAGKQLTALGASVGSSAKVVDSVVIPSGLGPKEQLQCFFGPVQKEVVDPMADTPAYLSLLERNREGRAEHGLT